MKSEDLTENQKHEMALEIAEQITGFIQMVDLTLANAPEFVEKMKITYDDMAHQQGMARALPFPETQAVADKNGALLDMYKCLIALFEARMAQREQMLTAESNKEQMANLVGILGG